MPGRGRSACGRAGLVADRWARAWPAEQRGLPGPWAGRRPPCGAGGGEWPAPMAGAGALAAIPGHSARVVLGRLRPRHCLRRGGTAAPGSRQGRGPFSHCGAGARVRRAGGP
eukprot:1570078-Lingulodinium_polyedra.AAC.1